MSPSIRSQHKLVGSKPTYTRELAEKVGRPSSKQSIVACGSDMWNFHTLKQFSECLDLRFMKCSKIVIAHTSARVHSNYYHMTGKNIVPYIR